MNLLAITGSHQDPWMSSPTNERNVHVEIFQVMAEATFKCHLELANISTDMNSQSDSFEVHLPVNVVNGLTARADKGDSRLVGVKRQGGRKASSLAG